MSKKYKTVKIGDKEYKFPENSQAAWLFELSGMIDEWRDSYFDEFEKNKKLEQQIANKDKEIADLKAEKERIKKNWMISRTQQRRLYDNLKNQYKQAGVVCYPIVLDGCRIVNEEQLLDFAKDMVLEKEEWKQEKKDLIIELKALNVDFNWQKAKIKDLEKEING